MSLDPASIGQSIVLLIGFFAFCWLWTRFGRLILGWSAIILFCAGQFGWAVLALWIWCVSASAYRRFIAEERAAGFYEGRWL